jgi:hypothetical protein
MPSRKDSPMTPRTSALASLSLLTALAAACSGTVAGDIPGAGGASGTGDTTATAGPTTAGSGGAASTASSSGSAGTTTSAGAGGAPAGDARPPSPGAMVAPDGEGSVVFAISKLYMGDTDRDGTPDAANGWKQYGFDIDGKISTATSTDLCKPVDDAAPTNVYPDGYGGIDNAFGKNTLPMLLGVDSLYSSEQNDQILEGKSTMLLDLENLGGGTVYDPLVSRIYTGGDLGSPPLFDGSDAWPVDPSSLTDPADITSAKVTITNSYVIGDTWVGQVSGGFPLTLRLTGLPIQMVIQNAVIAMQLDASHTSATGGTISGVIATDAFVSAVKEAAGLFDPSLCSGSTIDSILEQVAQASDILQDGTQDPTKPCDGISIGLGFDASQVLLGPIAPPTVPPTSPCP